MTFSWPESCLAVYSTPSDFVIQIDRNPPRPKSPFLEADDATRIKRTSRLPGPTSCQQIMLAFAKLHGLCGCGNDEHALPDTAGRTFLDAVANPARGGTSWTRWTRRTAAPRWTATVFRRSSRCVGWTWTATSTWCTPGRTTPRW